eukprot:TRINITY_DN6528_c0_g1_i1.p1 TRINITY_DN6528_c0_g1~~TRINITY_DN6528_c0_g1_i1.p1  ORF type:complete len:917 (+),score=247.54 TRINITY_DN6528_c0_g1_i1:372-2753(+)
MTGPSAQLRGAEAAAYLQQVDAPRIMDELLRQLLSRRPPDRIAALQLINDETAMQLGRMLQTEYVQTPAVGGRASLGPAFDKAEDVPPSSVPGGVAPKDGMGPAFDKAKLPAAITPRATSPDSVQTALRSIRSWLDSGSEGVQQPQLREAMTSVVNWVDNAYQQVSPATMSPSRRAVFTPRAVESPSSRLDRSGELEKTTSEQNVAERQVSPTSGVSRQRSRSGSLLHRKSLRRGRSRSRVGKEKTKELRWKRGVVIGQGAFGTVFVGLNSQTGEQMAVKSIEFNHFDKDIKKKITALQNEIALMKNLDHPSIVKYLCTERDKNAINIFMEYVPGGSIADLLKQFGALDDQNCCYYAREILVGLEYLHKHNVIHRDIKGANILLTVDGECKLADFGCSGKISQVQPRRNSLQGTPLWMAPEVIRQEAYDWSIDIWSTGCTVLEMLTAEHPFAHLGMKQVQLLRHVCSDDEAISLPSGIEELTQSFIMKCLVREPSERAQAEVLQDHEWIHSLPPDEDPMSPGLGPKFPGSPTGDRRISRLPHSPRGAGPGRFSMCPSLPPAAVQIMQPPPQPPQPPVPGGVAPLVPVSPTARDRPALHSPTLAPTPIMDRVSRPSRVVSEGSSSDAGDRSPSAAEKRSGDQLLRQSYRQGSRANLARGASVKSLHRTGTFHEGHGPEFHAYLAGRVSMQAGLKNTSLGEEVKSRVVDEVIHDEDDDLPRKGDSPQRSDLAPGSKALPDDGAVLDRRNVMEQTPRSALSNPGSLLQRRRQNNASKEVASAQDPSEQPRSITPEP